MGAALEQIINAFFWLQAVLLAAVIGIAFSVLLPLGMFRRTRYIAGSGLIVASYIFGVALWTHSALATFTHWGLIGLAIGLILLGLGVVPMAFIALAVHAEWAFLFGLAMLLLLTFGARFLAGYCLSDEWKG